MIITVPTIKKEFVDNKVVTERGTLDLEIDTSFAANLKWEEQFQDTLGYDLLTYTEMVRKWSLKKGSTKVHFIGMMKLLYCYVNSDKLPTFKEFAKLFDYEIADKILSKITIVLEQLEKTASKN